MPYMQDFHQKLDQMLVTSEGGHVHGGEGHDPRAYGADADRGASGEEGDAGHEEEQVSQVDESQGAHGNMGEVEGSR